jgi:hypothetical protein
VLQNKSDEQLLGMRAGRCVSGFRCTNTEGGLDGALGSDREYDESTVRSAVDFQVHCLGVNFSMIPGTREAPAPCIDMLASNIVNS